MKGRRLTVRNIHPGLPGIHQLSNARLAVAAIDLLLANPRFCRLFPEITTRAVARGLERVRFYAGLRGRLQRVGPGGRYLLDVAHNPEGIRTLVATLRQDMRTPLTVVFGVMKDKDYGAMLEELKPITGELVAVAPGIDRALPAQHLEKAARRRGIKTTLGGTVAAGIRKAGRRRVLVCGSHYVVGEAYAALSAKNT